MAQFSGIPAELRNLIYDALLSQSRTPSQQFSNDADLSVFGVSKQLHDEATSYFYQHNDICIDTPSPVTEAATILPPIADRYLRFLRRLRVRATIAGADSTTHAAIAGTITSLASIGAKFDDIHITLQSSLSRLVNSRVDDSILDTDNSITIALRTLLDSGVVKLVRLHLRGAWFTPWAIRDLKSRYGDDVLFVDQKGLPQDTCFVTRCPTGNYAATHMTRLGLTDEVTATADVQSPDHASPSGLPSSLSSSIGSVFADMDMFSVMEFDREADGSLQDESKHASPNNDSFFSAADIEEWEASTPDDELQEQFDSEDPEDMDMDDGFSNDDEYEDDELENLGEDEFEAIVGNMEDVAHHNANEADMKYLVNFAPEVLLSRHNLDHLM